MRVCPEFPDRNLFFRQEGKQAQQALPLTLPVQTEEIPLQVQTQVESLHRIPVAATERLVSLCFDGRSSLNGALSSVFSFPAWTVCQALEEQV